MTTSQAPQPSLDAAAVLFQDVVVTHRDFAVHIARARHLVNVRIPRINNRVCLSPNLPRYLAWVLRIALMAEGKCVTQISSRVPNPVGAIAVGSPADDVDLVDIVVREHVLVAPFDLTEVPAVWSVLTKVLQRDTPVVVIYTSGSTGRAKGVCLSGTTLAQRMDYGCHVYRFTAQDKFISHMGADTVAGFYLPLEVWKAGGALIFEPSNVEPTPSRVAYQSTVIMSPVTALDAEFQRGVKWPGRNLRRVYLAGSRVSRSLSDNVRKTVARDVNVVYGSTECGVTAHMNADGLHDHLALVGRKLADVDIQVVGDDGSVLPCGTEGRIAIRAPWGVCRYEDMSETEAFSGGWFWPGDLGFVDVDDNIFITGRTVDTLNYGGNKFLATDIESKLLAYDVIEDAFVTVIMREARERLIVVIQSKYDHTELKPYVRACLPSNWVFTIVPIAKMPRNHMGKLERYRFTQILAKNLTIHPSA